MQAALLLKVSISVKKDARSHSVSCPASAQFSSPVG
jgi:hypothetical protein